MELVIRTDGGHTRSSDIEKASRIDSCIYRGNKRALESKCHHFQWQQVDKNSLCLWQNSAVSDFFKPKDRGSRKSGLLVTPVCMFS